MAFDGVSDSPKKFVIGDDGVAVKADEATPAALVGSRESKLQRPDIINASAAIEASEEAVAAKEMGLSADPRMAQVERFSTAQIEKMIAEVAIKEGVDPKFALVIAKVESRFNQFAQSEDGAMGVMQLMPETAADLGVENPWDAAQNIQGGIKYLKALTAEFQHPLLVAAAYHSGPQAVHDAQGIPRGPRTAGYMVALLNGFYDIYGSSGAAARAPASKKNRGSSMETRRAVRGK
ncbi:lytic transglycosylase domain-containing protein [Sinorhizobium fredii]|uniref:lytic transglycosylase domain-containing protein n=1 Tax=Rhizobium fredii TaxID=380 RepID=UPI003513C9EE